MRQVQQPNALPIHNTAVSCLALLKFEWVNLAWGRHAGEPGTGETRPRSVVRPAGPVDVESARRQAFIRVVELFEVLPPGECRIQPVLAGTSRLARHPGFHQGRQLPGKPVVI